MLEVKNVAGSPPSLWLYGPIGEAYEGGVTADEMRSKLSDIPSESPIEVRINSEGGVYTEGVAIHSMLTRRKGPVHVVVDGMAYSAGSIVAMAGKTIEMARGSWMMIHEAMGSVMGGRAEDFRQRAEKLDAINAQIRGFYAKRWKKSESELIAAMAKELWMKDEDAVALGMADSVTEVMAVAAHVDLEKFAYKNAPQEVAKAVEAAFPNLEKRAEKLAKLAIPIADPKVT